MSMVVQVLEREEGWRSTPYYCTKGYPTVGYGFKLGKKGAPLPEFCLPRAAGDVWLQCLINDLKKVLARELAGLNEDRQTIILSMAYQMGVSGVLGFTEMWKAIRKGDYKEAAKEMLDSLWAKRDTPERAERHAKVMESGRLDVAY